jgi:hypothetical protein
MAEPGQRRGWIPGNPASTSSCLLGTVLSQGSLSLAIRPPRRRTCSQPDRAGCARRILPRSTHLRLPASRAFLWRIRDTCDSRHRTKRARLDGWIMGSRFAGSLRGIAIPQVQMGNRLLLTRRGSAPSMAEPAQLPARMTPCWRASTLTSLLCECRGDAGPPIYFRWMRTLAVACSLPGRP